MSIGSSRSFFFWTAFHASWSLSEDPANFDGSYDGVETIAGGEGPWIRGVRIVKPGVLLAGLNPVCTDAVGAAVMGYNPRAERGTPPFEKCDNILRLAEAHGVGTTDLKRIDVRGVAIEQALFRFHV